MASLFGPRRTPRWAMIPSRQLRLRLFLGLWRRLGRSRRCRARPNIVTSLRGRLIGFDLTDHELFLRRARTTGELRQLVGAEQQRRERNDADDDRRVDDGQNGVQHSDLLSYPKT